MNHFQDKKFLDSLYGQQDHIAFRGNFLKTYSNRKYSVRDIALRFLELPHGKRILDIGAGTGSFIKKIMQDCPDNNFAALEIAENAECREVPNLDYRIFDGVHFPKGMGEWDIVILMHMLYHVPKHKAFLDSVRKLVKKGGIVLITTKSKATLPHFEEIFQSILSTHFSEIDIPRVRDEAHFCSENGLEILRTSFAEDTYKIDDYPIETQIMVDNPSEVVKYVLSTPRYNPATYNIPISFESYAALWKEAVSTKDLFIDNVREMLYVITEKPRV